MCVSDAMVPPADNQSKQHTSLTFPYHHWATLLFRPADIGRVAEYKVVYNAPPPEYQSKQHTLSMPPSRNWAKISLKPADLGRVGGHDIG